jgi:hypothetical protein
MSKRPGVCGPCRGRKVKVCSSGSKNLDVLLSLVTCLTMADPSLLSQCEGSEWPRQNCAWRSEQNLCNHPRSSGDPMERLAKRHQQTARELKKNDKLQQQIEELNESKNLASPSDGQINSPNVAEALMKKRPLLAHSWSNINYCKVDDPNHQWTPLNFTIRVHGRCDRIKIPNKHCRWTELSATRYD